MDNRQIVVVSKGRDDFNAAMKLAFGRNKTVASYIIQHVLPDTSFFDKPRITKMGNDSEPVLLDARNPKPTPLFEDKQPRMVLFWNVPTHAIELPYSMNVEQVSEMVWGWLEQVAFAPKDQFGDVDYMKGFAVYQGSWGRIGEFTSAVCAVSPQWAWIGK